MAYWIFQSNPKYFDLPAALKELRETPAHDNVLVFLATKRLTDINRGDKVYVCFGGPKLPGLYATATILSRPAPMNVPEDWQAKYAKGVLPPDEKEEKPPRVRLKIEQFLNVPVARGDIYKLPELKGHQFVATRTGTNFWLTDEQKDAIERLIAAPRTPR